MLPRRVARKQVEDKKKREKGEPCDPGNQTDQGIFGQGDDGYMTEGLCVNELQLQGLGEQLKIINKAKTGYAENLIDIVFYFWSFIQ